MTTVLRQVWVRRGRHSREALPLPRSFASSSVAGHWNIKLRFEN